MELFIPEGQFSGEYSSKGSKFIALGYPVQSEEEVKAILREMRSNAAYKGSRHFCYAYRLGCPVSETRANDDGEPSGTAGKPILNQIESHQLTNILVVVVRFFGGILLGTGGLIQAYREATAISMKNLSLKRIEPMEIWEVSGDFSMQTMVENRCKKADALIVEKEFDTGFRFLVKISQKNAEEWARFLAESSHQSLLLKRVENC
jgi:uncharacterized YigZ family protein